MQSIKPRVCAVSYLNAVPLVWGMLHGAQRERFDLSFGLPAECADRLADRTADIGLVPVAEFLNQDLQLIPGCGIACHGAVRTILLISQTPFREIRTLALDSSSRTSVMLCRILLQRLYGIEPVTATMHPVLASMLAQHDAALIIGDTALGIDRRNLPYNVLDLGQAWCELTGLPMVFATWAARAGFPAPNPTPFLDSLVSGMAAIEQIASEYACSSTVTKKLALEYLTSHIVYKIGGRERAGLELFLKYAKEAGVGENAAYATSERSNL